MRGIPLGLRYMAESALYFSVMSALVKVAGNRGVPWEQIVFARSVFAVVLTFWWLRLIQVEPWGNARGWLLARGTLGLLALMCFFYSVTELPLADATVIQYTNPAFVAVFAVFIVGERLQLRDLAAVLLCLVGVVLMAEPSFIFGGAARLPLSDVVIAMGGAVGAGISYTIVRRLGRTEHPLVTVFYFPLVATPVTFVLALGADYVPNLADIAVLLGVGIASQAAQVRMTQGLKLERAGRATAVTYLQVVFAFGWGVLLFDEIPSTGTLIGTALIIGTTFVLARGRSSTAEELDVDGDDLPTAAAKAGDVEGPAD